MALPSETKFLIFSTFFVLFGLSRAKEETAYVFLDTEGALKIHTGEKISPVPVATVTFTDYIAKTGWSVLDVTTNASFDDALQAYAAGVGEGHLTKNLTYNHWMNGIDGYCKRPYSGYCYRLYKFLLENLQWVYKQIEMYPDDPIWYQVKLQLIQLNGLTDGYNSKPGKPTYKITDPFGFYMFQISGDVEDLESALHKEDKKHVLGSGSCSALIKLLPASKDLYISQDTWSGFQTMLRVLKKYKFNFHWNGKRGSPIIPGNVMTFSSYPGVLGSGDDFYLMSTGLVAQETTNGNNNADLWPRVQPASLLEQFRSIAANRLAVSGKQWTEIFKKYNSGTYNNQWMILDYKKFTPGSPSSSDLLWVLEQLPGMVMSADVTSVLLQQGYWASYNIPYFKEIFNASGCNAMVSKYGNWFSYEMGPRAQIFRRDQRKITDLDSMMKMMRYNNFKNDPLSRCNCTPPYSGENAISARSDLNPANGTYPFGALGHRLHGGTDMKLTSSSMFKNLEFVAVSGPTYDNLPPFQWSTSDFKDVRHDGLPDLWKFPPILYKWQTETMAVMP